MPDFLPDVEGANGLKRETMPMVLVASDGSVQRAIGPAADFIVYADPSSDVTLPSIGRTFQVLVDGVVSVTTAAGNLRTQTLTAGTAVSAEITHVRAATTATILVYLDA